MQRHLENLAASVHQCLLNQAKNSSRPFSELLHHFAIERFLHRFSKSPNADRLILKEAQMLRAWSGQVSRPTMDIHLLGRIDNSLQGIAAVMRSICALEVEEDGMVFDAGSVTAARITADAGYGGVRVRIQGRLGNARVHLQVDIGFGEVIRPWL